MYLSSISLYAKKQENYITDFKMFTLVPYPKPLVRRIGQVEIS